VEFDIIRDLGMTENVGPFMLVRKGTESGVNWNGNEIEEFLS
jgi:hypothetical protein